MASEKIKNVDDIWYERVMSHLPKSDDITLVVLKGHLLAEEMLDQIIGDFCNNSKALDKIEMSFYTKVHIAQAVSKDCLSDKLIQMLLLLNTLRNELAHNLESEKFDIKINNFIAATVAFGSSPTQGKERAKQLRACIGYLLGYFSGTCNAIRTKNSSMVETIRNK